MLTTTKILARWSLSALLVLGIAAPLSHAQPGMLCEPDGEYEPPSETLRSIDLPDFGIAIAIPENYQTRRRENGAIEILHPDDFAWLECLSNGGHGGGGYYSEWISLVEPDPSLSLEEQAAWSVGYQLNEDGSRSSAANRLIPYQHNGLNGYIATTVDSYSVVFLGTVSGFDSGQLLKITAGCDCEVELEALTDLLSRVRALEGG